MSESLEKIRYKGELMDALKIGLPGRFLTGRHAGACRYPVSFTITTTQSANTVNGWSFCPVERLDILQQTVMPAYAGTQCLSSTLIELI